MSTGKRLAKRSIIGTRVAALGDDGLYYSGMIQAVKTPAPFPENNNCINLTPNTRYTVRFDEGKGAREYRDAELIGPGFRGLAGVRLLAGQRVFLTYNGREVRAEVLNHDRATDELRVRVHAPAAEVRFKTPTDTISFSERHHSREQSVYRVRRTGRQSRRAAGARLLPNEVVGRTARDRAPCTPASDAECDIVDADDAHLSDDK